IRARALLLKAGGLPSVLLPVNPCPDVVLMRPRIAKRPLGVVRGPPPDDPRNPDHPSHWEQWLELARVLGRMDARRDFELIHGKPPPQGKSDDRIKAKARHPRSG